MIAIRLALAALFLCAGPLWDALRPDPGPEGHLSAAFAQADDDDDGGSDDDDDGGGSSGGSASDDDDDAGSGSTGASGGTASDDDDDDGSGSGGSSTSSDDDDDDGGSSGGSSGSTDDDDDDGGSSGQGGASANDDDDDDGGSADGRDDDDDDGGSAAARDDDDDDDDDGPRRGASGDDPRQAAPARRAAPAARVGAPLQRFTMPRSESDSDRARSAEISAANITPEGLARLEALGFRVIRSRQIAILGNTLALRLRTPGSFTPETALQIARQTVPGGVFDFSHLYAPSQEDAIYARDLVRIGAATGCGRGVRIGMIDTDVARHATLSGVRVTRRSFSDGRGDPRHGTAVASLLVGRDPSGGALLDGAALYAAGVFSRGRSALDADAVDIVAGLDWLVGAGTPVINVSIAGPANALLEAATEAAARRGAILVAAAGNGTAGGRPRYPAAYASVIAVSAVDRRMRPYASGTRGAYVDVAAPGVDVWAANAPGSGALWTGTSFAAPFVSVELAMAARRGEIRSVGAARRYLAANARDLGAPGRDPVYGTGLLQSRGC